MTPVSPDQAQRCRVYLDVLQREVQRVEKGLPFCLKIPRLYGLWEGVKSPTQDFYWPYHHTPEVFFQLSGQTEFLLPNEKIILREGEAAIMPRGLPHWELGTSTPHPFRLMVGMFPNEESFSFHIASLRPDNWLTASAWDYFPAKDHLRIRRLVNEIVDVHEEVRDSNHPHIRGLFLAYLSWVVQRSQGDPTPNSDEPELIQRCRRLVESEMARPELSVAMLARELQCSAAYLSHSFHVTTGMRLIQYIQERRLEQATHLLENTDMKISSIAWSCGFRNPSYFNRVFLKLRGRTPNAHRP